MPRVASPPLPEGATAGQVARAAGVSERVILGRKADGRLPVRDDGSIDLYAVIRAGITALAEAQKGDGAGMLDQARIEVLNEQRDRLRLLNAEIRGESVRTSDLDAVVGAVVDSIRTRILAHPARATPRLVGKGETEVLEILTEEAHEICGDLAATELVPAVKDRARRRASRGADGDADTAQAGAAAEADAQPVG